MFPNVEIKKSTLTQGKSHALSLLLLPHPQIIFYNPNSSNLAFLYFVSCSFPLSNPFHSFVFFSRSCVLAFCISTLFQTELKLEKKNPLVENSHYQDDAPALLQACGSKQPAQPNLPRGPRECHCSVPTCQREFPNCGAASARAKFFSARIPKISNRAPLSAPSLSTFSFHGFTEGPFRSGRERERGVTTGEGGARKQRQLRRR